MSEQTPAQPEVAEFHRPSRRRMVWAFVRNVVLQLLIFFVLYTLSIGPMFWKWYAGQTVETNSLVARFYHPLYLLAERNDRFGHFMNWYIDLWIG